MRLIRMMMETTIVAIESANSPETAKGQILAIKAATNTAVLRNVSAQTCYRSQGSAQQ